MSSYGGDRTSLLDDQEKAQNKAKQKSLSSLIISAFTQNMNDLQQKEIQRKVNSFTDGFKKTIVRQNLKKNKYLSGKVDTLQNKFRQGESYKLIDAHRLELEDLIGRFETDIYSGLSEKEAKLRLLKKKSQFVPIIKDSLLKRTLKEILSVFHISILIASILSLISYFIYEHTHMLVTAISVAVFAFLSAGISQMRQRKGLRVMENFDAIIPKHCIVLREGKERKISTKELVIGDIVKLVNGTRCPSDVRILASTDLYVNSEIYTGSSNEEYMHPQCSNKENPLNTKNMIFMGSKIVRGKGKGLVISTEGDTLFQDLGYKCRQPEFFPDSVLKRKFDSFVSTLSIVMLVTIVILLLIGIIQSSMPSQIHLQFSIGMILSALPLGIILVKTLFLVLLNQQLKKQNLDVNYIESLAALGLTTCICTDMTGTLTLNQPSVSDLWYDDRAHIAKNKQLAGEKEKLHYNITTDKSLVALMNCAILCNDSNFSDKLPQSQIKSITQDRRLTFTEKKKKLEKTQQQYASELQKKKWIEWPCVGGQPNEQALIKFFQPLHDIRTIRSQQPFARDFIRNVARIPFQTSSKFSCVICSNIKPNSHYTLYTKGAPSVVWSMCDQIMYKGKVSTKDSTWEIKFERILKSYGEKGDRVLAFSQLELPIKDFPASFEFNMANPNFPIQNQVFVGLISQLDSPDFTSANMVKNCKQAGIKVIMLTGEESLTSTQIAKECNVITTQTQIEVQKEMNVNEEAAYQDAQALVIDGDQVAKILAREEGLPDKQKGLILMEYLRKPEVIFTRVQPAHKVQIVKTLQKLGHVVTATGLGIRDSPALRQAEIGVSFALQGEQVAKDTSDLILRNDQFITLGQGIEKGRLLFDNLKKAFTFCLAASVPQIAAFAFFYLAEIPFGLTPIQVFILDMGLIHFPALFYVYLLPETPPMERKPGLAVHINKKMMISAYLALGWFSLFAGFFGYFSVLNDFGIKYSDVHGILSKKIFVPVQGDEFDPDSPWLGNSILKNLYPCSMNESYLSFQTNADLQYNIHSYFDLRLAYAKCTDNGYWVSDFLIPTDQDGVRDHYFECTNQSLNIFNSRPNCYTSEMFKFAQTAYMFSSSIVVIFQYLSCKSRIQSIFTDRLENLSIPIGIFIQFCTIFTFTFITGLNDIILTREIDFKYYGWFGIPFGLLFLVLDEIKKKIIRVQMNLKIKDEDKQREESQVVGVEEEKDNLLYKNPVFNQEMKNKFQTFIRKSENTWFLRNVLT